MHRGNWQPSRPMSTMAASQKEDSDSVRLTVTFYCAPSGSIDVEIINQDRRERFHNSGTATTAIQELLAEGVELASDKR